MTSAAAAVVWSAVYSPFGGAYTITGAEANNARFPGQWFQLEAGLHYNWHRHYDASLGRYTQPDPLGFVDGPSVYAYGKNAPLARVDRDGRLSGGELFTETAKTVCGPCKVAKAFAVVAGIAIAVYEWCKDDDYDDDDNHSDDWYQEECLNLCHQEKPDKHRQFCNYAKKKGWMKDRVRLCYDAANSQNVNMCEGYCRAAFGE